MAYTLTPEAQTTRTAFLNALEAHFAAKKASEEAAHETAKAAQETAKAAQETVKAAQATAEAHQKTIQAQQDTQQTLQAALQTRSQTLDVMHQEFTAQYKQIQDQRGDTAAALTALTADFRDQVETTLGEANCSAYCSSQFPPDSADWLNCIKGYGSPPPLV